MTWPVERVTWQGTARGFWKLRVAFGPQFRFMAAQKWILPPTWVNLKTDPSLGSDRRRSLLREKRIKIKTFWDRKMWDSCCSALRKVLENSKESRLSSCWENSKKIRECLVLYRRITKPRLPSPCTWAAMCLIPGPSTARHASPQPDAIKAWLQVVSSPCDSPQCQGTSDVYLPAACAPAHTFPKRGMESLCTLTKE